MLSWIASAIASLFAIAFLRTLPLYRDNRYLEPCVQYKITLSSTTTSTPDSRSKTSPPLISNPFLAPGT
jgi:hypothetical protein